MSRLVYVCCIAIGVGLLVLVAAIRPLVLVLAVAVLGVVILIRLLGFGGVGVLAGSVAAAWQSCIGNVARGSLFAILQSTGMAIGAISRAAAGAGAAVIRLLFRG